MILLVLKVNLKLLEFIRIFFVFGVIGFAVGIGIVVNHARMRQVFGVMNRFVSLRHRAKWLAVPRDIGLGVQRYPRLYGTVFASGGAFSAVMLVSQTEFSGLVFDPGHGAPRTAVALIVGYALVCARWFLIVGGIFAIAAGVMLIYFPKQLAAIETYANRWYSFRRHSRGGDTMHMALDGWVESHPRAMGLTIAAAALFVTIHYGLLLFVRS